MKLKYEPPTEQGKKRAKWFDEHFKPGMSTAGVFELLEQGITLFPASAEERRLKTESLEQMPEFVL
jgi:hypothetical protein